MTAVTASLFAYFSEEDWTFWVKNGYVIIRNAVPREQVKKLADYLWEYEDKDAG